MYCAPLYDYNIINNLVCDKMKTKLIISILILFALLSGCIGEKTITINADNYSKNVIQHVLDMSDKNITKYIDSITVYDDKNLLNEKCKSIKYTNRVLNRTYIDNYVGCSEMKYASEQENEDIDSVDIYILSDNQLKEYCDTEGNTLAYFIGAIDYNKKYNLVDAYYERLYSDEYADKIIKNKCDSGETKIILDQLNLLQDNYDSQKNSYYDAYNLSEDTYYLKWGRYIRIENLPDKYNECKPRCINGICVICTPKPISIYDTEREHSGIPQDKYYQYEQDYNKYIKDTDKYSNLIEELYEEYSKNYDIISDEYNRSIENYKYPFENGYQEHIENVNRFDIIKSDVQQTNNIINDEYDKKILTLGESWKLKNGYVISILSSDAPNNMVWISLTNNNVKIDDYVLKTGETYNYNNIVITTVENNIRRNNTDLVTFRNTIVN